MFSYYPDDVGLILTYRCHSGCKHCVYNCGPRWEKEAMSPETLREALEALAVWPRRPQVHLTGGEPFLHFPLLLEGARTASELGVSAYLETSGAWCTDGRVARERFSALRRAGLQAVLVSCSPFHAEHIPPARTLRTIEAALDVFGAHRVIVYRSEFLETMQRFDPEHPTPLSRYEETFGVEGTRRLLWEGYGVISGGRSGYALGHLLDRQPAGRFARDACAGALLHSRHSHFDLYGNFISGTCGGLAAGDWRDLPHVLAEAQAGRYPHLVGLLIERGPYGLLELAREEHDYSPPAGGYAGKCHLCVDVRRHLAGTDRFPELRPAGFYEHI